MRLTMDSGRLIFDQSHSGHHNRGGGSQMLLLGGGNPIFQGGGSMLGMEEVEVSNKRRPSFTSPDEMLEEYYDDQLPEKKRRLTTEQVEMLEKSFEVENKLEPERKTDLARKLGLQPRQVAVWFQNRRARWKTKQLERDFDLLKASYDALLTDHDALQDDNSNLRSQVTSLTEKLQVKNLLAEGAMLLNKDNHAAQATASENMDIHVRAQQQLQQQQKIEDRLSPGSGGSAVVDGEGAQLVDSSGESYFQESYQGGCGGGVGIHSEEDEASDEGCSYLPAEMFPDSHNNEGWWVWN